MALHDTEGDKPAPTGNRPATSVGYSLGIRRSGCSVEITVTAGSEYLAIELFDRLMRSAQSGSLSLELVSGDGCKIAAA